jgi:vitamin B12 transporter
MTTSRGPSFPLLATCLAVLVALPCAAASPTFKEEITVTATGSEEKVSDVPVPVSVISRQEIDDAEADTLALLLRRLPGLGLARSGGEGGVTSLFTRGTESDHTLVLFDGVRLNSPYFAGFDWSTVPTAGLDRVEVARGPYSALWGADAIGGVVNLIPRRAAPGLGGGLFAEGGGDSWQRLEANVAWADERFDLTASGFDRSFQGPLVNDDVSTRQMLVDAGMRWGSSSRVGLLVQHVDADVGVPFSGATLTPHSRQTSRQTLVAVPVTWAEGDGWTVEANAAVVLGELGYANPDDPYGFTSSTTDTRGVQGRVSARRVVGRHAVTAGTEWRRDRVDDRSSFGVNLDGASSDVWSLFAQDVWRPLERLRLVGGVRWDDARPWGSEVSPRLAVGWHLGHSVELRAGYGEAYRQPAVGELYFPFYGNPDLAPETSRSAELGLASRPGGAVSWQVTAFATDLQNLIEYDFASLRFSNIAEARIRGFESGLEVALGPGLAGSLQATFLDTEDGAGRELPRRPRLSSAASLHGRFGARLGGDLTVAWVGPRADVDPVTGARTTNAGFVTADVALAWRVIRGGELTLRVVNLADRAYQEVLGYPAPGRRVMLGVRFARDARR